jgi:hypothetical protein
MAQAGQKHEQEYISSEPPITPGYYGNIPPIFSIHLGGFGDSNLAYYFLCSPGPQPLFAVSGYTGARVATLHQTVDLKSAPLAYVTVPEVRFHLHGSISLPGPPGSNEATVSVPFDGSGGVMSPVYQFEATVGSDKNARAEMFAWQQVGKHEKAKPRLLELTRNVSSEKVAGWLEEFVPAEGKMATFQMLGSGASGELGVCLKLAAVVSALALARMD